MKAYQTKAQKLSGTSYNEVRKKAFRLYLEIKRRSKRKPYVRSAYFKKESKNTKKKWFISTFPID